MSFEENFLYPLILLGIGTGLMYGLGTVLTGRYQEKQKDRDREIEKNQRELDREREDRKIEFRIKHDLIQQISEYLAKPTFIMMAHKRKEFGREVKPSIEDMNNHLGGYVKLLSLIDFYYPGNKQIQKELEKFAMIVHQILIYLIKENDDDFDKKEILSELINLMELKITPEKAQEIVNSGGIFELIDTRKVYVKKLYDLIENNKPRIS